MVLSIKKEDFVLAEKVMGASNLRIILKHILPQTMSYVIIAMTLSVPSYILAESGLSFLGLGIQQPDASWGKYAQRGTGVYKYSLSSLASYSRVINIYCSAFV